MKSHALDRTDNSISQLSNNLSQRVILFLFLEVFSSFFYFCISFYTIFFHCTRRHLEGKNSYGIYPSIATFCIELYEK